jgi:hypothetical protein
LVFGNATPQMTVRLFCERDPAKEDDHTDRERINDEEARSLN